MNASITLAAPIPATPRLTIRTLTTWPQRWTKSERECYLEAASNHADLEQRLRAWEVHQRRVATLALLA